MVQRLIVPVDGSEASWRAADVALALARKADATVRIVQVVFDPGDKSGAQLRLAEGLRASDVTDVDVDVDVLLADSVASALEAALDESPESTIVMASHGRGRSAALVGSVADDVLQRTFGPIVVVGPNSDVRDFTGPIVVTVDGSAESEAALPLAAAWGIELAVTPWIVNVTGAGSSTGGGDVIDSMYASRLARQLAEQSGHRVEFEQLHEGHPAVSVPEYAERMGASLIVASSHGRSGLSRLTVGSVTSGFVRHARCPVVVVRLPHPTKHWEDPNAFGWAM